MPNTVRDGRQPVAAPTPRDPIRTLLTVVPRVPVVPPPDEAPASYEVRIRRSVGDGVCVVAHDGRGEPMLECRLRRKLLTPAFVQRMKSWCKEHDDGPDLSLTAG